MATPLGAMQIELGLDAIKFNPTLTGAKNALKYFKQSLIFVLQNDKLVL